MNKQEAPRIGVRYVRDSDHYREVLSLIGKAKFDVILGTADIKDLYIEEKDSVLYDLYLSTEANQTAIKAQENVLKEIAEKGSCVIVGRAADYVLKDYNPFKVFIYAPNEFRQKRIMANYGDSDELAKVNMEKADKRRAKFYENITGQEWGDTKNYNLSVDSSIGIEKSVEQIAMAVQNDNQNQGN